MLDSKFSSMWYELSQEDTSSVFSYLRFIYLLREITHFHKTRSRDFNIKCSEFENNYVLCWGVVYSLCVVIWKWSYRFGCQCDVNSPNDDITHPPPPTNSQTPVSSYRLRVALCWSLFVVIVALRDVWRNRGDYNLDSRQTPRVCVLIHRTWCKTSVSQGQHDYQQMSSIFTDVSYLTSIIHRMDLVLCWPARNVVSIQHFMTQRKLQHSFEYLLLVVDHMNTNQSRCVDVIHSFRS